jgi:hypothetical protein
MGEDGKRTDEMDALTWKVGRDGLFEDFGAIYWAACGGYASDEDLDAVLGEDVYDAAPVGDLERSDGRADGDGVEAEETVAEYDGVFWGEVCVGFSRLRERLEKTDIFGILWGLWVETTMRTMKGLIWCVNGRNARCRERRV